MACRLGYGKPRPRWLWSFSRRHGANPPYYVLVITDIHLLTHQWPYSYDSCDYGAAPNQSVNGLPVANAEYQDPYNNNAFSFLPGQKLSRCTCSGESHPGPMHSDGTYVGRSAPEIDVLEALVCRLCQFLRIRKQILLGLHRSSFWESNRPGLSIRSICCESTTQFCAVIVCSRFP